MVGMESYVVTASWLGTLRQRVVNFKSGKKLSELVQ